ncbi:Tensin-4 [Clonorchis sinensis]|uniref:Tensin-4 n=1 Tax=Clonorchis sinensis TaxID=79923 RepID=A0A8T1MZ97_CLOSI|nr:Tensin-4 [Clonorchis sinensis]
MHASPDYCLGANGDRPNCSKVSHGSSPSKNSRRLTSMPFHVTPDQYYYLPDDFPGIIKAVRNTSVLWFFPNMQTAETKHLLENQPSGSFIVRNNGSEADSYKLSFKSAGGVIQRIILDRTHNGFLIRGVREPQYYPSLLHVVATFCCQISVLPCLLRLPGYRPYRHGLHTENPEVFENGYNSVDGYEGYSGLRRSGSKRRSGRRNHPSDWIPASVTPTAMLSRSGSSRRSRKSAHFFSSAHALLPQGAACNLLYLGQFSVGTQSAGYAIKMCVDHVLGRSQLNADPTVIEFRVNENGITMTDLSQRKFSQRHYPTDFLQFIGVDPLKRKWKTEDQNGMTKEVDIFGFVSCNPFLTPGNNQCHLLSEYDDNERASVICDFTQRYLNLSDL